MTTWNPRLERDGRPLYVAIADHLGEDIGNGRLSPGTRLPTHRELARLLGVNVSTITRAYAEASRRGLLDGEVGRGTFVREVAHPSLGLVPPESSDSPLLDLSFNLPHGSLATEARREALEAIARSTELDGLFDAYEVSGRMRHRRAGADWLARGGAPTEAERTMVTGGGQHAMAVAFAALCQPGETVLTEALTYPGMKSLAGLLGLRLQALPLDSRGLEPEAFEQAIAAGPSRTLYCMPNLHNPTGVVMPIERRQAIAEAARAYGAWIVEDDTYGFLVEDPLPPIASFAPERTLLLTGMSKCLAAGMRAGFLSSAADAPALYDRLIAASNALTWLVPPLVAEIVCNWIEDGTAERLAAHKREECRARQALARELVPGLTWDSEPCSSHVWVELPEPWRSQDFVERARVRGVAMAGTGAFVVGRAAVPHAVRLCFGTPPDREALSRALRILADILQGAPAPGRLVV